MEEMKSALNSLENLLVSERTSMERSKHTNCEQRMKKIHSQRVRAITHKLGGLMDMDMYKNFYPYHRQRVRAISLKNKGV